MEAWTRRCSLPLTPTIPSTMTTPATLSIQPSSFKHRFAGLFKPSPPKARRDSVGSDSAPSVVPAKASRVKRTKPASIWPPPPRVNQATWDHPSRQAAPSSAPSASASASSTLRPTLSSASASTYSALSRLSTRGSDVSGVAASAPAATPSRGPRTSAFHVARFEHSTSYVRWVDADGIEMFLAPLAQPKDKDIAKRSRDAQTLILN